MLLTERWLFAVEFVQAANAKGFTGWSFYLNEKDQSYGISKHGNLSRTRENYYQHFGKMPLFLLLFFRPQTSHLNPNNTNSACPYLCCSYQSQSRSLIIIIPLKLWSNTTVTHFLPTLQTLRLGPHRSFASGEDWIQASSPDPSKCSRYQNTENNAGVTVLFHGALRPQKTYGLLGTGKWDRKWQPRPASLFTQLLSSDAANKRWPDITVLVERALLTIICHKLLSVTNHYLSQTVICHKQLSVTNCYLSQTIICHALLSVTNHYLSRTIICHEQVLTLEYFGTRMDV